MRGWNVAGCNVCSTQSSTTRAVPLEPVWNTLRGGGGKGTTGSCADGTYAFNDLDDGLYLVEADAEGDNCLQKNCPRNLGAAVDSGCVPGPIPA